MVNIEPSVENVASGKVNKTPKAAQQNPLNYFRNQLLSVWTEAPDRVSYL